MVLSGLFRSSQVWAGQVQSCQVLSSRLVWSGQALLGQVQFVWSGPVSPIQLKSVQSSQVQSGLVQPSQIW